MNNINFEALKQTMGAMKQDPELAMKKWTAKVVWEDAVTNRVEIRNFTPMTVDEPEVLGGRDLGPNPVENLIGAVGSCFAITFQVFASQQGIQLERVEVDVEADLNAAVFLGLEEGDGGILKPVIKLKVQSSASDETVRNLGMMALSKSPVLASLRPELSLVVEGTV